MPERRVGGEERSREREAREEGKRRHARHSGHLRRHGELRHGHLIRGGAGALVEPERTGYHFPANHAEGLAARLAEVVRHSPERPAEVAEAAKAPVAKRFAQGPRCEDYRRLIEELLD